MRKKEFISLQFNDVTWRVELLGEFTYLLIAPRNISIGKIHESTSTIKYALASELDDIVPSYHSIAIFCKKPMNEMIELLTNIDMTHGAKTEKKEIIEIPICYDLGLDLEEIASHSKLSIDTVVERHLACTYKSLFIGFTPGFVYADGLDAQLACPRKTIPRKRVEAGSIGIGGSQTGIYSLASPGGWNILGRTPVTLFDSKRTNPMLVEVGTSFKFYKITKGEFDSWES